MSEQTDTQLETALLEEIDIANGVFVAHASSGFGNTTLLVRLYVDSDETSALATAVDSTLSTTWNTWPTRPAAIQVEVVVGPKPADAGRSDDNVRDLSDVAAVLNIAPKNVHINIRLSSSLLIERYGK